MRIVRLRFILEPCVLRTGRSMYEIRPRRREALAYLHGRSLFASEAITFKPYDDHPPPLANVQLGQIEEESKQNRSRIETWAF